MSAPPPRTGSPEHAATPERRLVPGRLVRPLAALASACALILALLGALYHDEHTGSALDEDVDRAVQSAFPPARHWLLELMAAPTEPVTIYTAIGLIAVVSLLRRRPDIAALAVLGPLVAVVLGSLVLKPVFDRTHNGYLAYPSGHTASLVAVLTVLTLIVSGTTRPPRRIPLTCLAIACSLVLTAVAATALVGLDYHYVTDTAGGACCAVAAVLAVSLVIDQAGASRRGRMSRPAQK